MATAINSLSTLSVRKEGPTELYKVEYTATKKIGMVNLIIHAPHQNN